MPVSENRKTALRQTFELDFSNPTLGDQNWRTRNPQQVEEMELARQMLSDAAIIADEPSVPMPLTRDLEQIIERFLIYANQLVEFRIDLNQNNQPRLNQIIQGVATFTGSIFHSQDFQNERTPEKNFLSIYGVLQSYKRPEVQVNQDDLKTTIGDAKKELEKLEKARNAVAAVPAAQAAERFSTYYHDEAKYHSQFGSKFPWLGGAQLWLGSGFIALAILICIILHLPDGKDVRPSSSTKVGLDSIRLAIVDTQKISMTPTSFHAAIDSASKHAGQQNFWSDESIVLPLIHSLLIISLLIYVVRFSFRQFSVRKHLFTINRQKANLADTLILFLRSTLVEEKDVRQAIIVESIKGLASPESSGYIDEKNPEINFPVISEPLRAAGVRTS